MAPFGIKEIMNVTYRNQTLTVSQWAEFFNQRSDIIEETATSENRPVEEVALEFIKKWERQFFDKLEETVYGFERSHERIKSTGEVFTPGELVNEILDKLPLENFTDSSKTFVDPACGSGQFLIYVLYRKLLYGSTSTQALETTFGVDLMQDNVDLCRERMKYVVQTFPIRIDDENKIDSILQQNIVCADALKYDFSFGKVESPKQKSVDDFFIYE